MRIVKKICSVVSVIGIVVLVVGCVLSGYGMIMDIDAWKLMKNQLSVAGTQANVIEKISFRSEYFDDLAYQMTEKTATAAEKLNHTRDNFRHFEEKYDAALADKREKEISDQYAFFAGEYDVSRLESRFASAEERAQAAEITTIYEYIDSLTATAGTKGKKLALKPASTAEADFTAFYQALTSEHGEEETGTYFEFLRVSRRLLENYTSENTVKNAMEYMNGAFDWNEYLSVKASMAEEELETENRNLTDDFLSMMAESPDENAVRAFFEEQYANVGGDKGSYYSFVQTLSRQITENVSFDGSYASVAAAMQDANAELDSQSFFQFIVSFTGEIGKTVSDNAKVPAFGVLWKGVSIRIWLWIAGILMIVLPALIRRAIIMSLVRKSDTQELNEESDVLLRVEHLKQYFKSGNYVNKAVDDVSFFIKKGEVFGLVGESGCGKTTTGRTIINLYDPTDGNVYFEGLRVSSCKNGGRVLIHQEKLDLQAKIEGMKAQLKKDCAEKPERKAELTAAFRKEKALLKRELEEKIQKIQVNAFESEAEKSRCVQRYRDRRRKELTEAYEKEAVSLTGDALKARKSQYDREMEIAAKDNIMTKMQMIFQDPIASINPRMTVREIIAEGLIIRGIKDKEYIDQKVYEMLRLVGLVPEHADRYPHEFSGGQRQRIGIARAIVLNPELIIADEPISALDVSIQAQVINLLNDLREKMGLTILFIAHNLSVVKYFSDRIAVMYYGKIVELATSDELFKHPLHPYTRALLSAIPQPDPHYEKVRQRVNYVPATAHDYSTDKPEMHEIIPGHFIYCNGAELEKYKKELGE